MPYPALSFSIDHFCSTNIFGNFLTKIRILCPLQSHNRTSAPSVAQLHRLNCREVVTDHMYTPLALQASPQRQPYQDRLALACFDLIECMSRSCSEFFSRTKSLLNPARPAWPEISSQQSKMDARFRKQLPLFKIEHTNPRHVRASDYRSCMDRGQGKQHLVESYGRHPPGYAWEPAALSQSFG